MVSVLVTLRTERPDGFPSIISISSNAGVTVIPSGTKSFTQELPYNTGYIDIVVSVSRAPGAVAIGVGDGQREILGNVLPGETTVFRYYMVDVRRISPSRVLEPAITLRDAYASAAGSWSFVSNIGGVECGVYVDRLGTYVKYEEIPYVVAGGVGSTLTISPRVVSVNNRVGILLPSQLILTDTSDTVIPPYFSVVNSGSIIHSDTLAYSIEDVTTPFNPLADGSTLVYKTMVARFYLVARGRYTVRYGDRDRQSYQEAGGSNVETLETVKVLQQILNGSVRRSDGTISLSNNLVGTPIPVRI